MRRVVRQAVLRWSCRPRSATSSACMLTGWAANRQVEAVTVQVDKCAGRRDAHIHIGPRGSEAGQPPDQPQAGKTRRGGDDDGPGRLFAPGLVVEFMPARAQGANHLQPRVALRRSSAGPGARAGTTRGHNVPPVEAACICFSLSGERHEHQRPEPCRDCGPQDCGHSPRHDVRSTHRIGAGTALTDQRRRPARHRARPPRRLQHGPRRRCADRRPARRRPHRAARCDSRCLTRPRSAPARHGRRAIGSAP